MFLLLLISHEYSFVGHFTQIAHMLSVSSIVEVDTRPQCRLSLILTWLNTFMPLINLHFLHCSLSHASSSICNLSLKELCIAEHKTVTKSVLTLVYITQKYGVSRLCPLSRIPNTKKHNLSQAGSVSIPR
jgi:hypothetical protein